MTILGAVSAVLVRKFRSLVAEIRTLVNRAAAVEKQILGEAKVEAELILQEAKAETAKLKSELIEDLAKL